MASNVDYLLAKRRWGIEFIDIPMEEVYCLFYQIKDDDIGYEASVFANRAIACREGTPEDLLKAMRLYQAVKIICEKKKLDAVTLSCFSLIEKLGTTGCLALALLNDEGIPAGTQHFELLPYPIHLLTDGQQNSLAASLEIATWIRSKGMKVHIIHGTIPNMVKQLIDHHKAFAAQRR